MLDASKFWLRAQQLAAQQLVARQLATLGLVFCGAAACATGGESVDCRSSGCADGLYCSSEGECLEGEEEICAALPALLMGETTVARADLTNAFQSECLWPGGREAAFIFEAGLDGAVSVSARTANGRVGVLLMNECDLNLQFTDPVGYVCVEPLDNEVEGAGALLRQGERVFVVVETPDPDVESITITTSFVAQ